MAMSHNKVPKSDWGHLLSLYLSGRAQESFHADVTPDMLDDYEFVKSTLLTSLGDTPTEAARHYLVVRVENYNAFCQQIYLLNDYTSPCRCT